jgi:hypothetical protein
VASFGQADPFRWESSPTKSPRFGGDKGSGRSGRHGEHFCHDWIRVSRPKIRVAMVARREHICPQETGLLVAAEEGLQAHICESESEAIAWLDAQAAKA